MDFFIRKHRADDQLPCLEIRRRGWLFAYSHIFSEERIKKHFDQRKQTIENRIEAGEDLTSTNAYVAESNGKQIAIMVISETLEKDNIFEIKCLYVDPEFNRGGVGQKLFNLATEIAVSKGAKKMHIEALKDNHVGCSFYSKNGGKIIGTKNIDICKTQAEEVIFEFDLV